jgi:hypothetical protein
LELRRVPLTANLHLLAADGVLLLHFAWVAFVVVGLPMVWLGAWRKWNWVRAFGFRMAHLLAMAYVAWEAVTGRECPLTIWENRLRILAGNGQSYQGSFIQHWVHRILFFEFSETAFTLAYCAFLGLIAVTFWLVPPRFPWFRGESSRATEDHPDGRRRS